MKKIFLSFIAMVLCTIAINAKGTIGLSSLSFSPGETKVLSIELNDETAYTAFQMDLALPAGFSIATTTNEDDEEVLDITIDASRKKSTHQLSYNKIGEGVYRIAAFSSTNTTFKGTSGAIVNVAITAGIGISAGSYTVELKNVAFTTPEPKDVKFNDATTSLEVIKSTPITSYTASVNCGPEGTAMLSAYVVTSGSPLKLLIAPNDGYKVSSLLLNGNKVNVKNNIYNIAYVTENVVFDVAFAQVKPDTVEVEKIVTDTIEVEKIITDSIFVEVTDTLVVEKIVTDTIEVEKIITDSIFVEVTDTLVVEKIVTDTIEIETIEIDTIYLAEINNIPTPEITFANGMMSISCALQGAKIFYSTDGTLPTQEYSAPVAIEEDCVVMAIAVVASETASMEIIGTGIGGGSMINEIVSCRYFTEAGVEIDEPREGINIMIIEYANGKTETKKVVVRKK